MANSHLGLTLFSLGLFFSLTKPTFSQDPSPTVFEILPKFGLPSGLLPNTVKSYSLSGDGSFTVYLEKECYVEFDYLVYYEKIITGKLSYGSIVNLKGIQVQRLFILAVLGVSSGSCGGLWKQFLELPAPNNNDVQMLLTE
ncbi:T31J12.3 PROTEIN-RELATED [Salix viminalis]|uniref:T31J12.3 PROTEIN-RELATED n=1 Tax=Salix viminalis TaxID=40686 RepID=A0A9Q0T6R3_SALVM|nr:T31J12.3 PROTEIN-RELATED [Salix viminalis]